MNKKDKRKRQIEQLEFCVVDLSHTVSRLNSNLNTLYNYVASPEWKRDFKEYN